MADLLSYLGMAPEETRLEGQRLVLRPPRLADYDQWAPLRALSRDFLQPWEPTWAADELTPAAWRQRMRGYWRDMRNDAAYPFFLFQRDSGELLGGLTLSDVRRGAAQAATLGYWIGMPHAGQGYMSEAVRLVLAHAFGALALHRVEAACIPDNAPSRRLLRSCGFRQEGLARRYLKINGQWRDHLQFAITVEEFPPTA